MVQRFRGAFHGTDAKIGGHRLRLPDVFGIYEKPLKKTKTGGSKGVPALDKAETALLPRI